MNDTLNLITLDECVFIVNELGGFDPYGILLKHSYGWINCTIDIYNRKFMIVK